VGPRGQCCDPRHFPQRCLGASCPLHHNGSERDRADTYTPGPGGPQRPAGGTSVGARTACPQRPTPRAASYPGGGGNDTAINCRVEKCTGKGLHPGGGLRDSLFTHNVSRENGDDGLYFCAKVLRVTVSANQLIGNKANGVGGLGDWGDTLNTVTKNVISGNGMHGVQMADSISNSVIDNTISNNSQSAPGQYSGIWLRGASKNTVKDNRCFDDQTRKTQKHGIDELADCRENAFVNNDSHDNVQANVLLAADQPPEPQPTARPRARAAAQPADQARPAAARAASTPRATKAAQVSAVAATIGPAEIVDYNDPTYGGKIRELRKDDGHEHNFYYYRDVWNADGSRMLGIQVELLKSFAPLMLQPNGPSCNQAGDRLLVVTSDGTFRSYHLPDMTDERTFQVTLPAGCFMGWDKPHYTGYRNYIDTAYNNADSSQQAIVVYDDTGAVVHTFDTIGGGGHYDWSPDGKLAYFRLPTGDRGKPETPFEIHVVNLDGGDDRVLFTVPQAQSHFNNLHLSWPSKVNDWFVAGFYPMSGSASTDNTSGRTGAAFQTTARAARVRQAVNPRATLPATPRRPQRLRIGAQGEPPVYEPPFDEILLVRLDGTTKYLARTGTVYSRAGARGATGDMFWAQVLPSPSADGRRICFNSCRAGTIDLHILFLDTAGQ
jgi:parallel beta-helix repeat protein